MTKSTISAQARLFCWYLACCGNAAEAAASAGYEKPNEAAVKLLMRPEIRRECKSAAAGLKDLSPFALKGLERLAFGNTADALRLLFYDESDSPESLSKLDLFCVSEIRKPKGGGLEVKLYDRQKALEALLTHGGIEENGAYSLYNALEKAAGDGDTDAV